MRTALDVTTVTRRRARYTCGLAPARWFLGIALVSFLPAAATDIVLLPKTVVDANGLDFGRGDRTRFAARINGGAYQQSPLSTLNGYQYTTYYNADRHVCVGRRRLPDGVWEILPLTDYVFQGSDSHNVAVLGLCAADGTIHLAFDHHGKHLNYRVSAVGTANDPDAVVWDASLFSAVTDELRAVGRVASVTYPRFVPMPNGNLLLYYRQGGSGSGGGMIQAYDGASHKWVASGMGKFIARTGRYEGVLSKNSQSRNPYLNAISYGGDRLHVSWVWREHAGGSQYNHDLCYIYSDDGGQTWCSSAGTVVGVTGLRFITVDTPGVTVARIAQGQGLMNQTTHYAFPDGRCHVVLRHALARTTRSWYVHYWRDEKGRWRNEVLSVSPGSRPKLVGGDDGMLLLVYTLGGDIRICKGVPNAVRTAWSWSVVTTQADANAGGEGLVDLERWQQEQILSVYDQEESLYTPRYGSGIPVDADPAPLNVWDYQILPTEVDQSRR